MTVKPDFVPDSSSITRTAHFHDLLFWPKLVSLNLCIVIYSFVCQFPRQCYWYCYNQKQSSVGILQKRCSYKLRKIDSKILCWGLTFNKVADLQRILLSKNRLRHRCFLLSFTKFLRTTFAKYPLGQLLLHNQSFCLLFRQDLSPF